MKEAENLIRSFMRFAAVGVSFSLVYAVLTAALISVFQAPAYWTSVLVYLACIPLAFAAQRRFAFSRAASIKGGLLLYGALQLTALVVVSAISSRFVQGIWFVDTAIYFFTAGLAAVASFVISRFVIFRIPRAKAER